MPEKKHPLEAVRNRYDWTYRDLSDAIYQATSGRRDPDCWRRICQFESQPTARTQYWIDRFLEHIRTTDRLRDAARAARAARKQRKAS